MSIQKPLRIVALLEASSISGTAKAILEMAYEAKADVGGGRKVEIFIGNFARGTAPVDNALTRAVSAAQIPISFIREKGRFDQSVIPQIQHLVREHQADVIWTNSVKSHFLVRQSGIQKSCRWVAFHHGYTSTDLKMLLYNQLDRVSLRRADRVLTVCEPFAKQMIGRGVKENRIRVQHMPIRVFSNCAEDSSRLLHELSLPAEAKVILSIGRLSHEKGHVDLIAAFGQLREQSKNNRMYLVMVGDGPERANLEAQAKRLDLGDHVLFVGHRDDAKRFYGIAAVFALPSYTEGTPNVLLEAMAARVPVVATNVGGIPELASHERNALLVPARNIGELAKALEKLTESSALGGELAQAALEVVAAHSPEAYFGAMRKVFEEVAAT